MAVVGTWDLRCGTVEEFVSLVNFLIIKKIHVDMASQFSLLEYLRFRFRSSPGSLSHVSSLFPTKQFKQNLRDQFSGSIWIRLLFLFCTNQTKITTHKFIYTLDIKQSFQFVYKEVNKKLQIEGRLHHDFQFDKRENRKTKN